MMTTNKIRHDPGNWDGGRRRGGDGAGGRNTIPGGDIGESHFLVFEWGGAMSTLAGQDRVGQWAGTGESDGMDR